MAGPLSLPCSYPQFPPARLHAGQTSQDLPGGEPSVLLQSPAAEEAAESVGHPTGPREARAAGGVGEVLRVL